MRSRLVSFAKVCVSLVLLVIVLLTVDISETLGVLRQTDGRCLLAALGLYLLGVWMRAHRWAALLEAQDTRVPVLVLTKLYFVGAFFNNFLPSGIGGDVVKMYELSSRSQDAPTAVSTVLVDRALGLLVLFAIALMTLPWGWQTVSRAVVLLIIALCIGSVLTIWLFLNRDLVDGLAARISPLQRLLDKPSMRAFYDSFHRYRGKWLWRAALLSLLFNITLIAVVALIGRSLRVDIPPRYYFLFVPIISVLLALPISLSGLGIREGGYVYLFAQVGVAAPVALSMSLGFYAVTLITGLIGGVIYAIEGLRSYRQSRR